MSWLLLALTISFDAGAKDEYFAQQLAAAEALANSDAARGEMAARALVKESVDLGDPGKEVEALRVLGFNLSIQQKSNEALAIYAEALEDNDERQFPILEGLLLRHRGVSHYDTAIGMSKAQPVGVVLVDIDHFKRVNDELGHDADDEVLRQVSARIQACLSTGELWARWGGEEFLVTHEHTPRERDARVGQALTPRSRRYCLLGRQ